MLRRGEGPRAAAVVVRSASERSRRAGEALRGAVGLAAGGLAVRVVLVEDGAGALALAGEVHKALATLRTLGHEIIVEAESLAAHGLAAPAFARVLGRDELPDLLAECDVVETWR
ncbi:MAG TPA: hypothetical protein VKN99_07245 [Polyangia bacterium]|nr:hypothetical protein [Polyangia bacterium]